MFEDPRPHKKKRNCWTHTHSHSVRLPYRRSSLGYARRASCHVPRQPCRPSLTLPHACAHPSSFVGLAMGATLGLELRQTLPLTGAVQHGKRINARSALLCLSLPHSHSLDLPGRHTSLAAAQWRRAGGVEGRQRAHGVARRTVVHMVTSGGTRSVGALRASSAASFAGTYPPPS